MITQAPPLKKNALPTGGLRF